MANTRPTSDARVHAVIRARWIVLALFAGLCAWLVPGVGQLRHDDDVLAFLPPEHPDVVAFREIADRFGMLEVGLVGLRTSDGSDMLTAARSHEVREVARRVSELPGVRLVLSYPDLPDLQVEGDTLAVDPLVPLASTDDASIRTRVLASQAAVGSLIAGDGRAAALLVYVLPPGAGTTRADQLQAIRDAVAASWDGEAFFGGGPFIENNAAAASRLDIERLSPIVIAVLLVCSALLLRSVTAALLNLVVAGLGVALVVGAHGRFGEPFTIVSGTTPVLMVALGGAFGMHIISGYQRRHGAAIDRADGALRELWLAVVLSAATTAVSFFALVVMPQHPMQSFGVVAGLGVLGLLVIALVVLPGLLSLLPASVLRPRPAITLPFPLRPPTWLLAALAAGGIALGVGLRADSDTRNVFDPDSEPIRADRFFNEHFGGAQFLQIAIVADMREPVVLRMIRDMVQELRGVEHVADVRSLVEPVTQLNEGFGGRRGLPANDAQAGRVLANLADHPAMAQLLTTDLQGAIIHVKLAPGSADAQLQAAAWVREIVARQPSSAIGVGEHGEPDVAAAQREAVRLRVGALLGRALAPAEFAALIDRAASEAELKAEAVRLRDRALGTDEVIEPLAPADYAAVDPGELVRRRGSDLQAYLRAQLPVLVAKDPEGIRYVAEQLEGWIDDARGRGRIAAMCATLGLANPAPPLAAEASGPQLAGACREFADVVSELDDTEWSVPEQSSAPRLREVPISIRLTGQPIIGQAFADSVTSSLVQSTAVSWVALLLVLILGGHARAIVPATWTLAVTAGIVALLGHPIGVGTSMVSCVALGSGVDFAIHLSVRARAATGADPGREAVDELGGVAVVTGLQLAAAFLVLLASEMPPLRQFGLGLAVGLLCAAAGAVFLAPRLFRRRPA